MREDWRGRLQPNAARLYDTILTGVRRRESRIPCGECEQQDIQAAAYAVSYDHPELYYFSTRLGIAATQSMFGLFGGGGKNMTLMCEYIYSEQEIRLCESKIQEAQRELRTKINARTTEEEKVILVAEYIVANTTYQIDNTYNQNAASALCYGRAQCSGVSAACKLLLDWAGVECIYVRGEGDDGSGAYGPHAWNIVRIGTKYYNIDVTFMLGANKDKKMPLKKIFLFYDDNKFGKDHKWDRTTVPQCTDSTRAIEERNVQYVNQYGRAVETPTNNIANNVTNGAGVRNATPVQAKPAVNQHPNAPKYSSLSEFKIELAKILKARKSKFSCYLRIDGFTQQELSRMVLNAISMVKKSSVVNCGAEVKVHQDFYIEMDIEY